MREDGSIMPSFLFVVSFRIFVWKMCLKEAHIGSLKDLEAFRISEDATLIEIGLLACVNEDLFFPKQRFLEATTGRTQKTDLVTYQCRYYMQYCANVLGHHYICCFIDGILSLYYLFSFPLLQCKQKMQVRGVWSNCLRCERLKR